MIDLRQLLTTRSPTAIQCVARGLLRTLSVPYRVGVACRNRAYDSGIKSAFRSPLPVISVGNLSVGGTGKSPTVAWLAKWFRQRDVRVAILSRGYGQLDSGQNDEALELELQLPDVPHLQHWDRVASAQLADEELGMQLLLLDDGFQHRRIARDLEIVLLDASEPPAARRLLPGGLLREPLSALGRADLVLLTRSDQAAAEQLKQLVRQIERVAPQAEVLQARHRPARLLIYPDESQPLAKLAGKRVLAFCAIGNPQSFFASLGALGASLLDQRTWPDHHAYSAKDIAALTQWGQSFPDAELMLCTLKDWVKIQLRAIGKLELAALAIDLEVLDNQTALEAALEKILRAIQEASTGDAG